MGVPDWYVQMANTLHLIIIAELTQLAIKNAQCKAGVHGSKPSQTQAACA